MPLQSYFLTSNPFHKKQVVDDEDFKDQPFIPTDLAKRFSLELKWGFPSGDRSFYSVIGKKGVGKTSFLLYLKEEIEKMKTDDKKPLVIYFNKGYDKISDDNYFILFYMLFGKFPDTRESPKEEVDNELKKYHHIYFLFDMPEEVIDAKEMRLFAKLLDFILRNHYGSILITMNQNHYIKLSKITNIVGESAKITTFNLMDDYNKDLMLEIAKQRIKISRENGYTGSEYFPFDYDSLSLIAKTSSYIPRNFIIGCNKCLFEAQRKNRKDISEQFVIDVLQPSFIEQIINNKVSDDAEKKLLLQIIDSIKKEFDGKVENATILYKELKKNGVYKPNYPTLVRRVNNLQEWGIVSLERNYKTPRGKSIEVIKI
jgi:hypothetical protein